MGNGILIVQSVAIALIIVAFGSVSHMALKQIFKYVGRLVNRTGWEYNEDEDLFK